MQIVETEELMGDLQSDDGIVEFVDPSGNRLGILVRPPSEEDIRIAKDRLLQGGKSYTTEEVVAHLRSLEQP